jgi:hypothetical protein
MRRIRWLSTGAALVALLVVLVTGSGTVGAPGSRQNVAPTPSLRRHVLRIGRTLAMRDWYSTGPAL